MGKPVELEDKTNRIAKSGALTPSPDRLERTAVDWFGVELPKTRSKEYGSTTLPVRYLATKEHAHAKARAGLPLLVFLQTQDCDDDEKLIEYTRSCWQDEYVGVASRFFNCYRLSLDDMKPADRKIYSKGQPVILLIDGTGKTLKKLPGWNVTGKKLFKAMDGIVRKQWKKSLKSLMPKQAKILRELDEVHDELERLERTLAATKAHIKKHDCAPGRKRLKRTEKSIKECKARREKALAAEKKLYGFAEPASE